MEKFRFFFFERIGKNGSKNGGNRASTTSSSSEFCADFKNGRLFGVGPAAVPENRHFLSEGGTKIGFFAKKVDF